jgi:hypothetical protein
MFILCRYLYGLINQKCSNSETVAPELEAAIFTPRPPPEIVT